MNTLQDWIALAAVVLPLIGKMLTDWAANQKAAHDSALARIVGMAGRQAASIAREMAKLPATATSPKSAEISLVHGAMAAILTEMGDSVAAVGADADKVASIVQGEVDKRLAGCAAVASVPAPISLGPSLVPAR